MKTLNLKIMKKAAFGFIMAVFASSAAFANDKTGLDNNTVMTEELELVDSWMTDLSSWNTQKISAFKVDMEEELALEVWMINVDSQVWYSDQEEEMEIEGWMTNIAGNYLGSEELEENLSLEAWMLDPSTWLN
jgi:hypothetical protein